MIFYKNDKFLKARNMGSVLQTSLEIIFIQTKPMSASQKDVRQKQEQ